MSEIVNRVANSKLVTFDLEEIYPEGERVVLDIKEWLFEGLLLREKEFRAKASEHDWSQYQNKYVAITCSSEAIIPGWAFMLLASHLEPYVKKVVKGSLEELEGSIFQEILANIDTAEFNDKPLIIKGCSKKPVPDNAYVMAVAKLQPIAKSIMYGEACSSVPIFKKK
jgi:hypothetical protein